MTARTHVRVRGAKGNGLKVRTTLKAGGAFLNHNEMLVRSTNGLKVRTSEETHH